MLSKLLKYDSKALSRFFVPTFGGFLAITLMNKIFWELSMIFSSDSFSQQIIDIFTGVFTTAYILGIIAVVIMSQVFIAVHFYKNLTGDEGYLMFTLPVKTSQILLSKIITSFLFSLAAICSVIVSFFILAAGHGVTNFFSAVVQAVNIVAQSPQSVDFNLFIVELLVMLLLSLIFMILNYFAAISLGQLFNSHKLLGSIVSYIAIQFIIQIISTIFLIFSSFTFDAFLYGDVFSVLHLYFLFSIVLDIIFICIFYFITHYMFSKKLNLD